ncbi:MAG: hypothetical protein WCS76_03515, partial [Bacilli bacterium]
MEQVAFTFVLMVDVAVIVAFPAETPVTTPLDTVATLVLFEDQVTELLVPAGEAVTVKEVVFPTLMLVELGEIDNEDGAVLVPHIKSAYS